MVQTRTPELTPLTSDRSGDHSFGASTSHEEHETTLTAVSVPCHHPEILAGSTNWIQSKRLNPVGGAQERIVVVVMNIVASVTLAPTALLAS